ncbi:cation diffusion facilitator family transporter [Micromonospora sp. NPDC047620]|uniref:cation diffusion facilitator family transporter n=1 Tax=Micromonospora sp. NPDC047620 TaxID=3364251 RepID=UPI0037184DB1
MARPEVKTESVGHEHRNDYLAAYVVLAVSFAIESVSLARAVRQIRTESLQLHTTPRRFLRLTADPAVKAVFFEDAAALIGLVLAAVGLALSQLTGEELWDGLASILIGVLLLVVATVLARSNISLLVGRAVPERVHREIAAELAGLATVRRLDTLLTMQLGPADVLVAAKLDFDDEASGATIEAVADEAERRLTARYSQIRYVFLDPTGTPRGGARRPDDPPADRPAPPRPPRPALPSGAALPSRAGACSPGPGHPALLQPSRPAALPGRPRARPAGAATLACRAWCDGGPER